MTDTDQYIVLRTSPTSGCCVVARSGRLIDNVPDLGITAGMTGAELAAMCKAKGWTWKRWPQDYPPLDDT